MSHAAVVGQTERARTLPQTDQRDVAPRAEAHAGVGRQLAQGQGALRPAPAGVGAGQRGGPEGRERRRVLCRSSLKAGQEEKDGRGCPPKGFFFFFLPISRYLFSFLIFFAVPCHAWVGIFPLVLCLVRWVGAPIISRSFGFCQKTQTHAQTLSPSVKLLNGRHFHRESKRVAPTLVCVELCCFVISMSPSRNFTRNQPPHTSWLSSK